MLNLIAMIIISYLVGSIPTGIIAGKLLKGIDIRQHGSGNAGATNVFRVLGWKAGIVVLLIDMAKGLVPVVWVSQLGISGGLNWDQINFEILAGLCAVFGHIWTIFAGFKGGKGVGTGAGMVIGLAPITVLICLGVFVIVVAVTRYVSLGSILASIALPVILFINRFLIGGYVPTQLLVFSLFIMTLIIYTHRSNIKRLLKGEESKIKFSKSS
jgi:glycerol-3-phosphate acyltransferase PlsY